MGESSNMLDRIRPKLHNLFPKDHEDLIRLKAGSSEAKISDVISIIYWHGFTDDAPFFDISINGATYDDVGTGSAYFEFNLANAIKLYYHISKLSSNLEAGYHTAYDLGLFHALNNKCRDYV